MSTNIMTTKLHDYSASGFRVDFGKNWERFLVNFNIKQLTAETLKLCLWDDLSEQKKRVLYRDYQTRGMPNSEKILCDLY